MEFSMPDPPIVTTVHWFPPGNLISSMGRPESRRKTTSRQMSARVRLISSLLKEESCSYLTWDHSKCRYLGMVSRTQFTSGERWLSQYWLRYLPHTHWSTEHPQEKYIWRNIKEIGCFYLNIIRNVFDVGGVLKFVKTIFLNGKIHRARYRTENIGAAWWKIFLK